MNMSCEFGACGGIPGSDLEPGGMSLGPGQLYNAAPVLDPGLWAVGYIERKVADANSNVMRLTKEGLHWFCKPNPAIRILTSVRNGAVVGAVGGGIRGFIAGEAAAGLETAGTSGAPGWAVGAATGGTLGMGGGLVNGFSLAYACDSAGAYN